MCTFKEFLFGFDPEIIDPNIQKIEFRILKLKQEKKRISKAFKEKLFFNTHFLKKIPQIEKSDNVIYIFSLNYSPKLGRLIEEYRFRNLRPTNAALLLKFNLKNPEFKEKIPGLTYLDSSKKGKFYYTLSFLKQKGEDKMSLDIITKDSVISKEFYFFGERRLSFLERVLNFFNVKILQI